MNPKLIVRYAVVCIAVTAGCATSPQSAREDMLGFLHQGQTTREEVLLKLGQPSASFEKERIFTYRMDGNGGDGPHVVNPRALMPWGPARYSLVIVFNTNGVFEKQSLVKVK